MSKEAFIQWLLKHKRVFNDATYEELRAAFDDAFTAGYETAKEQDELN